MKRPSKTNRAGGGWRKATLTERDFDEKTNETRPLRSGWRKITNLTEWDFDKKAIENQPRGAVGEGLP